MPFKYPNIKCDNVYNDYNICYNCIKNNLNDCITCPGYNGKCNACKFK